MTAPTEAQITQACRYYDRLMAEGKTHAAKRITVGTGRDRVLLSVAAGTITIPDRECVVLDGLSPVAVRDSEGNETPVDENLICDCGFGARSKGGLTNHQNACTVHRNMGEMEEPPHYHGPPPSVTGIQGEA